MSTRHLVRLALLVTLVFGAQARFLPYLPGDPALAHAVQAMAPGTAWVAPLVGTASAPFKYGLMAIAVLGAWRLAGLRAALVVIAAIALEQTLGEASKGLFGRPRPSRALVAVMGNPSGLSFPSTFMTLYAVTVGALVVLARRHAPSTAIAIRPYLNGALAVPTKGATHAVPGAMAWTACASAGSPGK